MGKYIINRAAIRHNAAAVQRAAGVPVIAVVKANGYGMGLEWMAATLHECGIRAFAITELSDIAPLQDAVGTDCDILMLRSTALTDEAAAIVGAGCIASVGSAAALGALSDAARAAGTVARAHIKVDVGLGRYGFSPDDLAGLEACFAADDVAIEGIYAHFPGASNLGDLEASRTQLARFVACCEALGARGHEVGMRHMANSPALFNLPEARLDAVRAGSAFLGRVITAADTGLERVGILEAPVIDVKDFPADTPMGYGGAFRTKRATRAAIVPVGTQDGFGVQVKPLSDFHQVLAAGKRWMQKSSETVTIEGRPYPVLGVVDLSLSMVDVTDGEVAPGAVARIDINPLFLSARTPREYC
ncbi:alanine racemase [Adlercreutzia mucosicola]|uniref:alanine racemase n=1 Tax=Adlercreutzia mucosicola TaxID=580026 RepID=UPI0003FF5F1E|nr:alanine racemase [Adlercreutzia mucosicola]MCR2034852.1 alanine racemase [Adlercreutzia mucosicola]